MFIPKLRADSFCHLTQSFSGVLVQPPQENLTWYLPVTGDRGKHFFWVALSESAFEMRLIQGAFFWAPIQKHPEIHLNLLLHMTCGIDLFRQTNPKKHHDCAPEPFSSASSITSLLAKLAMHQRYLWPSTFVPRWRFFLIYHIPLAHNEKSELPTKIGSYITITFFWCFSSTVTSRNQPKKTYLKH